MQNLSTQKQVNELKAVFEIIQNGRRRTLIVRKDRIVIGSVESADVRLTGAKIAPIHAVMELKWGTDESKSQARILDLASPTGVTVNGAKVVNHELKNDDRIQVGDAQIVFSFKKPEAKSILPDQALLLIDESQVIPIFDYRPPVKEALEVVYSWNNTILDVKHFVPGAAGQNTSVKLGGNMQSDFVVPPVFAVGSEHVLASNNAGRWTLNLDNKMKGVVYINGNLQSIEDFRRTNSGSVALGENDFAKIEAGSIQFYLSQTLAPPVLRQKATIVSDPFLARALMSSILFTVVFLFAVSQMTPTPVEQEQVPETIATILYHPEKYSIKKAPDFAQKKPETKQTPVPDVKPKKSEIDFTKPKEKDGKVAMTKSPQPGKKQAAQSQSKEGEGSRAKGNEGQRGAKHAQPDKTHKNSANRPSPQAGTGRGGTVSQVPDNGNVQMLKGATNKILDLLGGSGQKLGKSGSKLSGFGGFATEGNGGLAMAGNSKGGGGNADTLLGGLGDKGRGGGKVGTGLGAEGTGSGIVGGKTRVELNAGGGDETVVVGAIDRDAIDAAIRAHRDEFRYCYEREVNAGQPNLSGKIVTAFVIGGSGRASQMAIASSSMGAPAVERCVLNVVSRIQFPQPAGGVPVTIKYPFAFSNSSK
ncbi:MAG: AgmX/PglI C-terminal domain-containing protein [Bdellovibrionales bacterium]|nr:AgmX/PglI C-terminal domain-containing protein [Bdellovibrionales bacterium]